MLQQAAAVVRRARANRRLHKTGAMRREPGCDVLEGRQLLSVAGGRFDLGGPAMMGHAHSRGEMHHMGRLGGHDLKTVATTSTSSTDSTSTSTPTDSNATTPPQSTSSTQHKTDFEQLRTDQQAIAAKSSVTVAQEAAVRSDFQSIRKDTTGSPSSTAQTTLQNDIKALNGLLPTAAQQTQLQTDYTALLNSEGVTDQTLITKTINDLNAIVQASNVTNDDLKKIIADRQAITNDMGTPSSTTGSSTSTTTTPDPLAGLPFNMILGSAGSLGHPGGPMGGFGRMGGWGGRG
jgi:hypothetical protein